MAEIANEIKLARLSAKLHFNALTNKGKQSKDIEDLSDATDSTFEKSMKIIQQQNQTIEQLNKQIKIQRQEIM